MSEDDYLVKLFSLRELSTLQRGLAQVSSQVDSYHGNYMKCKSQLETCQREREELEEERRNLSNRISEIDQDIAQLTEVCGELDNASELSVNSAPLEKYNHTLADVNTARESLKLHPLPDSIAYTALSTRRCVDLKRRRSKKVARPLSARRGDGGCVVGPSYKSCPGCDKAVARNAVTCSNCATTCSNKRRKRSKMSNSS